jgi:creatine kinase
LTTRCRTGRSVRGTRLPPCTTFEERRELERVIVKGLMGLTGDLKGEYFPLHGSQSFAGMPGGMSIEKEDNLRSNGNLFQEPDSTLLLSSGCGRHWPDARGKSLTLILLEKLIRKFEVNRLIFDKHLFTNY